MPISPKDALDALETLDKAAATVSSNRAGHLALLECTQALREHIQQAAQLGRVVEDQAKTIETQARQINSLREQLRIALESPQSVQRSGEPLRAALEELASQG